jgi:hypothetical protein
MNPGLIPPADVAAAAKRALSCARNFTGAGHRSAFIAQGSYLNVSRSPCALLLQ